MQMRQKLPIKLACAALSCALLLTHAQAAAQEASKPPAIAPMPFPAPVAPAVTPDEKTAKAAPSPATAQQATDATPLESLFFTQSESTSIHNALASYPRPPGEPEENFLSLPDNKPDNNVKRTYTYPQFFLESLVYHSASDWTVRVNHRPLSYRAPESGDLRVVAINQDKALIEWKSPNMYRINKSWNIMTQNQGIQIDNVHRTVTFPLSHNQTFSTYTMTVLEGKVLPVTVTVDSSEAMNDSPDAEKTPNNQAPSAPPEKTNSSEGLGGLLNSYQHLQPEKTTP